MFCFPRPPVARARLTATGAATLRFEAMPVTGQWSFRGGGCGKQAGDGLGRGGSNGWRPEPGSNPRPGTTPAEVLNPTNFNLAHSLESKRQPKNRVRYRQGRTEAAAQRRADMYEAGSQHS